MTENAPMTDYLDWIKSALKKSGKTRAGLALALGRAPSAVTAMLKGERALKASEINAIAKYLEVDPPNMDGHVVRVPAGAEFSPDPDPIADFPAYTPGHYIPTLTGARPEIDGRAGAGLGTIGDHGVVGITGNNTVTGHRVVSEWVFPHEYFRHELNATPQAVIFLKVDGDSMRPTLEPGDRIIIDTHQKFGPDAIYLIDDGEGDEPRVKRLTRILFSTPPQVVVSSDNTAHKEQTVELARIRVLGRVVGRVSRI